MPSASDLVAEQGQLVRRLKTEKAGREEIQEAVQKLKVIRRGRIRFTLEITMMITMDGLIEFFRL